ncbi:MAG TPA: AraC family transcriptional regulator [Gaiellaceae bacterium]|nr:AraC family transcriptional regulator [Gaiellaceae bacterium]
MTSLVSSAWADERLFDTHTRRSADMRRLELLSPWTFCVPETVSTALHSVLQGACRLVPTAGLPPLRLGRGDLVLLAHGTRHVLADDASLRPAGRNGRRSLLVSGGYPVKCPLPLLASLPEVVLVPADRCREHGVRAIVDLLEAELEKNRPGARAVVPALADALLPLVVRAWLDDCAEGPQVDPLETLSDLAIAAALELIQAEPERAWTITALAREVVLSRSAFAHRFTRAVGQPPHAYLVHLRMIVAGRLLRESDLSLAEVAHRVGYASEFAFAKAFKRDYGIAPGGYRRAWAAEGDRDR